MKIKQRILHKLLQLDGATLKSDSRLKKLIKRNILKPIGYYFRKMYFNLYYQDLKIKQ